LILRGLWVRTLLTSRFDPTATSLGGLLLVQLIVATLGVLLMSGEYFTAAIRSAFAAVPKRLPMLWVKGAVFGVTTFVLLAATSLAAFLGDTEGPAAAVRQAPGNVPIRSRGPARGPRRRRFRVAGSR